MGRNTKEKVEIVLAATTFKTEAALLSEVSACVTQSETVKGKWMAMVQGIVAFYGNDRAKIVSLVGDGNGVKESDKLKKAVTAGLPMLSRTLLETERSDTAEENKEARDAAQANVSTYIRRIRQGCFDILEGKKKTERTAQDKLDNAIATLERAAKQLQGCEGEFSLPKMVLGYLIEGLKKGTGLRANLIGVVAMLTAKPDKE